MSGNSVLAGRIDKTVAVLLWQWPKVDPDDVRSAVNWEAAVLHLDGDVDGRLLYRSERAVRRLFRDSRWQCRDSRRTGQMSAVPDFDVAWPERDGGGDDWRAEFVSAAVARLGRADRSVAELYGLSVADLGRRLGVSVDSAKRMRMRVIGRLKDILRSEFHLEVRP